MAYLIIAATTRPLPIPVWSPIMNPLPASALRIANTNASICSAENFSFSVSGSILRACATYSSTSPTSRSTAEMELSMDSAIALGTNVPTEEACEWGSYPTWWPVSVSWPLRSFNPDSTRVPETTLGPPTGLGSFPLVLSLPLGCFPPTSLETDPLLLPRSGSLASPGCRSPVLVPVGSGCPRLLVPFSDTLGSLTPEGLAPSTPFSPLGLLVRSPTGSGLPFPVEGSLTLVLADTPFSLDTTLGSFNFSLSCS